MSLCQIYSCSPALSLLPPSLGSRASKYHFWVVHSGRRWQKCGHTCLPPASWASDVVQGLRWPRTQETWPPAPHLHMYDIGTVVWSPCPSCSPFTKSKVMEYSSGLVFENELGCVCESAHIHTSADTDAHAFSVTDTFSQEFPSQIAGTTYPRQKTPS